MDLNKVLTEKIQSLRRQQSTLTEILKNNLESKDWRDVVENATSILVLENEISNLVTILQLL